MLLSERFPLAPVGRSRRVAAGRLPLCAAGRHAGTNIPAGRGEQAAHAANAESLGTDPTGNAHAAQPSTSSIRDSPDGSSTHFDALLGELAEWVNAYGSCHVPSNVHDCRSLARWVQRVRRLGSSRDSPALTGEQRRALDALGFVWKPHQVSGAVGPRGRGSQYAGRKSRLHHNH
jgi:hypothetical protein